MSWLAIRDAEQVSRPFSCASLSSPAHGDAVMGVVWGPNAAMDVEVPYKLKASFVRE